MLDFKTQSLKQLLDLDKRNMDEIDQLERIYSTKYHFLIKGLCNFRKEFQIKINKAIEDRLHNA